MDPCSRFTYQLCNSAKAALIFLTELSTSSLIITRYLVRETVQRCKSFTDFSMLGPKIENKNCTVVRKLVLVFLNEAPGIVQHIISPDQNEVGILLKSINPSFSQSLPSALQFLNMFAEMHPPNQINIRKGLLIQITQFNMLNRA